MNTVRILATLWALTSGLPAQELLIRPERTDYRETSRYADVMDLLGRITTRRDDLALGFLGLTTEGRAIPYVIVAPSHLRHPARAHASDRLVVYVQANIHAGEVAGKEAVQILLREIAAGSHDKMLQSMVLLVVPIFNVDGNEAISTLHRRNQIGPEGGVGKRATGLNLDLNRDYIKAEAPETRASLRLINAWDPHLLMDLHTTNGCKHRYALTYASSAHPNADRTIQDFADKVLLPEVTRTLAPEYHVFHYGNWLDRRNPSKGWGTFAWQGRYCSNYHGLRNRFIVLSEVYAYRDFRTRVDATRKFVTEVIRFAVRHREKISKLTREADRRMTAGKWKTQGIQFKRTAWPGTRTLLGYEVTPDSRKRRRPDKADKPKDYEGPVFLAFEASESVAVPAGYLFPRALKDVADHLGVHGIRVYRLAQGGAVKVEVCRMTHLERSDRLYQGRSLQHAEVTTEDLDRPFEAGDFYVPVAQPLGRLAAELLEPRGRDGLLAWNFLDNYLAHQWRRAPVEIPVYRARVKPPLPMNLR